MHFISAEISQHHGFRISALFLWVTSDGQLCENLKRSACFSHCTELIKYLYVLSDFLSQNDSSIKQELPGQ